MAVLLLGGMSVLDTYCPSDEMGEVVYAVNRVVWHFPHDWWAHYDENYTTPPFQPTFGELKVPVLRQSRLFPEGCRFTAPLTLDLMLNWHPDEVITIHGFDQQPGGDGVRDDIYGKDRWKEEGPWWRAAWDAERCVSYGLRQDPFE